MTAEEQSMQKTHERREPELDKLISGASSDATKKQALKLTQMKRHSSPIQHVVRFAGEDDQGG